MTFRAPSRPALPTLSRRGRIALIVVAALVVLGVLFAVFVSLYTDLLWFRSIGFAEVFTTRLRTQVLLFVMFGAAMAAIVGVNVAVAYRLRPPFRPTSAEQRALDRYRLAVTPYRWWILAAVCLVVGIAEGVSATGTWRTWLLWRNHVPFHHTDPQFHRDVSYYAFTYPMQRLVLDSLFVAIVVAIIAAAITHYLYGGLRPRTPGEKVTAAARAHLSVLLGLFVLCKAAAYWLDRYGLAFSDRGVVTGPSYTDVHAVLPAKSILVAIAVICAVLFFATVWIRNWVLPATAFGLMVLSAIVIGGIYPAVVQQFRVKPNEAAREAPYIKRNITETRTAYGLNDVRYSDYSGTSSASPQQVAANTGTVPNIRLLDPNMLADTFDQLQQIRSYYGFPDSLDIDRYTVNGKTRDYVVAARELDQSGLQADQRNWVNEHLVYTHGMGFVAAPANTVDPDGRPVFAERDVPPTGDLGVTQPRVYFGEMSPEYSIVDTKQRELDYDDASGQKLFNYDGKAGVSIGGLWHRLLFAAKFQDKNLLFSSALTDKSRILYVREPRARVQQAAPFLTLDGDPYPAVVNGRIVWILDGYTTSDGFPYSQQQTLGNVASDSSTNFGNRTRLADNQINYIRNSVKATVDAYDGTVTLYTWDPSDPVLKTWKRAFPGLVKPRSAIPADLMAHFRYPEDLFKVQRQLIGQYHVSDPKAFYSKQDFWGVPADPNDPGKGDQPPYYQLAQLPGQSQPTFDLTSPLVFRGKENLAAYVYVSSDPKTYGEMRVLALPKSNQVNGPGQAENSFRAYAPFSQDRTLLSSGGSSLIEANLLTLPLDGGLLYVQPVYVQSTNVATSYPLLQKVLVLYGDDIGYGGSLADALDQVFGAGAGQGAQPSSGGPSPSPGASASPGPSAGVSAALRQAIQEAQAAFDAGQAALAKNPPDFAAYGQAQQQLSAALNKIAQLSGKSGSGPSSSSPAPSGSPAASASPSPGPSATGSPG